MENQLESGEIPGWGVIVGEAGRDGDLLGSHLSSMDLGFREREREEKRERLKDAMRRGT